MADAAATILVIDDEEALRESMSDYLEDRGFRVLTAENGCVGLEVFERERPDLVLTDLRMPEVDGLEVLRLAGEISPETPLIVVSGTGHISDSVRALRLGAWDYILKPIEDMSIIAHCLEKAFERARLRRENRAYQEDLEHKVAKRTEELEQVNAHLTAINTRLRKVVETTRTLAVCSEIDGFAATLLDEFAKHMFATGGSLYFVGNDGLRRVHALESAHTPEFIPFPLAEGSVLRRAIEMKEPLLIPDIAREESIRPSGWEGYRDGSLLAFPLPNEEGDVVVVLTVHNKTAPPFLEQDREVGAILASYGCESLRAIRAMESLRESVQKHERLVNNLVGTFLYRHDAAGLFEYVSPSVTQVLGYTRAEFLKHFSEYMTDHPKNREVLERTALGMRGLQQRPYEVELFSKDGGLHWIEVSEAPVRDANGQVVAVEGVAHDITERKRAEEALNKNERLLTRVLESMTQGILVLDTEYKCTYWNATLEEITKLPRDEVLGCVPWMKLPSMEGTIQTAIQEAMGGAHVLDRESGYTVEDGTTLHTLESCVPLADTDGAVTGVLCMISDITEQKSAAEEREELEAQLRQSQKMEAVGQLAGGVAHDFNNLLQVILGYGDIALDGVGPDSPLHSTVGQMLEAGHRAKTLVSQLLAFSRRQVLAMEDVNLNDVIADLMKMIRRVIGEHITLDILSDHGLGTVRADRGQIEQILMNLCVNARDAMPDGGTITIKTENAHLNQAYCENHSWAEPGLFTLLSVTDTGCGMDEATVQQVFDPFFTTKELGQGTGLGLATVYGLAQQHQGMVHVQSEVAKGTTFKVYLPLVEGPAAAVVHRIEGPVPRGTETILLAEDDEMVRELTEVFLERAGYTVLTAADGEEAWHLFEEHASEIDLALLDVMMPKLGGGAVFERIRAARPDVRVLFASGYSMDAIHTNFVLDKGFALIQKPCQRDDLLRKVRETLDEG